MKQIVNGCQSAAASGNAAPTATPNAPSIGLVVQPTCTVGTGTVTLNGLPAGSWTINPGNIPGSGSSTTITLSPGSYTFTVTAAGCESVASANVVINPQPSTPGAPSAGTITQPTCTVGTGSVELSGLPSSGTWTLTRNPGNVTSTGTGNTTTVGGLAAGTYTFTVTFGGCTSLASGNVVIDPAPSAVSAPSAGTITQPNCSLGTGSVELNGLPSSGTWTLTRNPGNVTSTGTGNTTTVGGLAPGTYTFTVSLGSCTSVASGNVVIDPAPDVPSAPTSGTITQPTCSLGTGSVVLNGLPSSGTWTLTRNPGNVTSTGTGTTTTVSPLAPGTYTFTVSIGACTSVASGNVVIDPVPSVATTPTVGLVTQPSCSSATGSVAFSGLPASGTWTLTYMPGNVIQTGTGTTTTFSGIAPGTYTFTVSTSALCTSAPTGNVVINAAPASPQTFTVTGGGGYCSGTGLPINLSGSQLGVNYQLKRGGVSVGSPIGGSGNPLAFPVQTVLGTYTVDATPAAGGCTVTMAGSAVISSGSSALNLYLVQVVGTGYVCASSVQLSGSDIGVSYQLKRGGSNVGTPVPGTGAILSFGPQNQQGYYSVVAIGQSGGCTRTMTGSPAIQGAHLPNNYNVTGGGAACSGTGVALGLSGSQTGVNYQLVKNSTPLGSPIAGTGAFIAFPMQLPPAVIGQQDVYTVVATNPTTGCVRVMGNSATISLSSPPIAYTVSGGGNYCGSGPKKSVTLSNSQNLVRYQLYLNGNPIGSPIVGSNAGGPITFTNLTLAGVYTIKAEYTQIAGCLTTMSGSATISCTATKPAEEQPVITKGIKQPLNISITAYPNPSENYFNVTVRSPIKAVVELRMFDLSGKIVEAKRGATDQVFRFGDGAAAGMYIIEARQAGLSDKATIKVIKVN